MKKFTFVNLLVVAAFLMVGLQVNAQSYPQEGLTVLPFGTATPDQEVALVLDVRATCPDSALLDADSVMMHSGVTIGENAWQHVIAFDQTGANGQSTRLYPFSPGAMVVSATTQNPFDPVSATDNVIIVVWPKWTAPAGAIDDVDTLYMHSGIEVDGQPWQHVVEFNGVGANGQRPVMSKIDYNGMTGWMIMIKPVDFYGVPDTANVTAINCVFNGGDWDHAAKDYNHAGEPEDFRLQLAPGKPYKYSMMYVPNDFYGVSEDETITAIDCVFNGGAWDAGEGKAHNEAGDGCEDFKAPLASTVIFNHSANNDVAIYPNPVNDVLNITNVNNVNEVVIFDVTGKVVKSQKVNGGNIAINVSDLHKGVYVMNIYNDHGVQTKKFMKN
jgi:hypothetical protein